MGVSVCSRGPTLVSCWVHSSGSREKRADVELTFEEECRRAERAETLRFRACVCTCGLPAILCDGVDDFPCLHSFDLTCVQSSCSPLDLVTSRAGGLNSWVIRVCTGTSVCADRARGGDTHYEANSSWCVSVTTLSLVSAVADTGILTAEVPSATQFSKSLLVVLMLRFSSCVS